MIFFACLERKHSNDDRSEGNDREGHRRGRADERVLLANSNGVVVAGVSVEGGGSALTLISELLGVVMKALAKLFEGVRRLDLANKSANVEEIDRVNAVNALVAEPGADLVGNGVAWDACKEVTVKGAARNDRGDGSEVVDDEGAEILNDRRAGRDERGAGRWSPVEGDDGVGAGGDLGEEIGAASSADNALEVVAVGGNAGAQMRTEVLDELLEGIEDLVNKLAILSRDLRRMLPELLSDLVERSWTIRGIDGANSSREGITKLAELSVGVESTAALVGSIGVLGEGITANGGLVDVQHLRGREVDLF